MLYCCPAGQHAQRTACYLAWSNAIAPVRSPAILIQFRLSGMLASFQAVRTSVLLSFRHSLFPALRLVCCHPRGQFSRIAAMLPLSYSSLPG
ncbi:MAG: hypothetical protein QHC79_10430 [Pseudosphingobacterium sp.]|nr:hypothetical protein [Pseudosphingobacterium sp.]